MTGESHRPSRIHDQQELRYAVTYNTCVKAKLAARPQTRGRPSGSSNAPTAQVSRSSAAVRMAAVLLSLRRGCRCGVATARCPSLLLPGAQLLRRYAASSKPPPAVPPRVPPRPRGRAQPTGASPGNAVAVRAQAKPIKAVGFQLGYSRARREFLKWAKQHGALSTVQSGSGQLEEDLWHTVTGSRTIGGEEQDLFSARPIFVPFYSFKLADGSTRHVYAGNTFDAVSLQVSLADDLDSAALDDTIGSAFAAHMRQVDGATESAHVDEWSLGVEAAWAMTQAASYGVADAPPLGVGRLLLPAWCFGYKHIGVTMLTWVSGVSGDVAGISHLAFWEDESLRCEKRLLEPFYDMAT